LGYSALFGGSLFSSDFFTSDLSNAGSAGLAFAAIVFASIYDFSSGTPRDIDSFDRSRELLRSFCLTSNSALIFSGLFSSSGLK
jgi:hypothetical protein